MDNKDKDVTDLQFTIPMVRPMIAYNAFSKLRCYPFVTRIIRQLFSREFATIIFLETPCRKKELVETRVECPFKKSCFSFEVLLEEKRESRSGPGLGNYFGP